MSVTFYYLFSVVSIPLITLSLLSTFSYLHHKQLYEQQSVETSL